MKCFQKPTTSIVPFISTKMCSLSHPRSKGKLVAKMLNAIHAQENKAAARAKRSCRTEKRKLKEAVKRLRTALRKL